MWTFACPRERIDYLWYCDFSTAPFSRRCSIASRRSTASMTANSRLTASKFGIHRNVSVRNQLSWRIFRGSAVTLGCVMLAERSGGTTKTGPGHFVPTTSRTQARVNGATWMVYTRTEAKAHYSSTRYKYTEIGVNGRSRDPTATARGSLC